MIENVVNCTIHPKQTKLSSRKELVDVRYEFIKSTSKKLNVNILQQLRVTLLRTPSIKIEKK